MNAIQTLLTEHLDIWTAADTERKSGRGRASGNASSVYGIKKLRELILELAVRGKLVAQDANDEPASELLKRIQAEKAKLIAAGQIKKDKPLLPISEDEKFDALPQDWVQVRLGDIAYSQAGFAFKSNGFNESGLGLPLIRIRDVGQVFTGTYFDGEYRDEFVVRQGDYLISMDGEFRVAKWLNGNALLNQRVSRLIFLGSGLAQRFIAESLQARLRELQGVKAYTTVDHLSGGQISNSVIALPPVAEQHRIVAKVDELMALCDQLENQHSNAAEAHETLVSHLLSTLTQSQNTEDFSVNWQRIAAHFDTLFTTDASIDTLKQTLLQLAVMGKLVPQDPTDEPARELLKRIQTEKTKLIAEGKIKKDKPLPPITEGEKPFSIPQGWEWIHLQDLLDPSREISYGVIKLGNEPKSGGIHTLRCSDVKPGFIDLSGVRRVSEEIEKDYIRTRLTGGEVLLNIRGTLGGVALAESNLKGYNVAREVAVIPVSVHLSGVCLVNVMRSNYFWNAILDGLRGIAYKGLNLGSLRLFAIPLPPISEQARIVAKVDELMMLCDQLKSCISDVSRLKQKLADLMTAGAISL